MCVCVYVYIYIHIYIYMYYYIEVSTSSRLCEMSRSILCFYGEELLAPPPTLKPEDRPFSDVCDWLFSIFATIGGRSSLRIGGHAMLACLTRTEIFSQRSRLHVVSSVSAVSQGTLYLVFSG